MLVLTFSGCKSVEAPPTGIDEPNNISQTQNEKDGQEQLGEEPEEEASANGEEDSEGFSEAFDTSKIESEEVKQEDKEQGASNEDNETDSEKTGEPASAENKDIASLTIEGTGIDKALILSLDDLKEMKESHFEDDFYSLNSYGTKEYFHFKGIKLKAILGKAGLKEDATTVRFVASDGYNMEFSLEQMLKEDYIDEENPDKKYPVIIAWHENGKDYDASKGAPFRLVMGQKEPGDVNKPQWVQNIAKIVID